MERWLFMSAGRPRQYKKKKKWRSVREGIKAGLGAEEELGG